MNTDGVLHQTCQECNGNVSKPVAKKACCPVKKDCCCGLRTASDDNHEPRVGFTHDAIVYDPINNRKFIYDSNGIYTEISGTSTHEHGHRGYDYLAKIKDYLYDTLYDNTDYEMAYKHFASKVPNIIMPVQCTSVYKDGILGRNFDWTYDENAEFLVKTPRRGSLKATIGIAGGLPLTKQFVESGTFSELYDLVPFYMRDGINEDGLMVSTNVTPNEHGDNKFVIPTENVMTTMCTIMLPRFVLDNFKTAAEAVGYLEKHAKLFAPAALVNMGYDQQFIIADRDESYIVEFKNGGYDIKAGNIITNFYVNDVNFNSDGTVNTPETAAQGHYATQNNVTLHGQGLERYNLVVNEYGNINSVADMEALLKNLYYTKSYSTSDAPSNPFWYTEAVGGDVTVDSLPADFAERKAEMGQAFVNRSRNGETWQTVHSIIYDPFARKAYLSVQEDETYDEYALEFDYTNEDIDRMLAEKQDVLIAGDGIDITGNVISNTHPYPAWGNIEGNLADQTDLKNELDRIDDDIEDVSDRVTTAESDIDDLEERVTDAESDIEALETRATDDEADIADLVERMETAEDDIDGIETLIPNQATSINQLADKAFVNSTVQTNTANFRGNWANWAAVPTDPEDYPADYTGTTTPSTNDYMVVQDASGYVDPTVTTTGTWRFKYTGNWATDGRDGWHPEYQVNETPMTAAQLAALNSGATTALIGQITTNQNDITALDAAKQDVLTAGANITIAADNTISATDTTYDDFTGATSSTAGAAGLVPAPTVADVEKFLKGDGTWAKAGGGVKVLTTDDYNYPASNPTTVALWLLEPGIYRQAPTASGSDLYVAYSSSEIRVGGAAIFIISPSDPYRNRKQIIAFPDGTHGSAPYNFAFWMVNSTGSVYSPGIKRGLFKNDVVNDLVTTDATSPLSANQGKVLKDLIDALDTPFTGTDGTTAGEQGLVPAPATTDAGKFLKADGTWDTVQAGHTVVQTTGTSTTDVMSQKATTELTHKTYSGGVLSNLVSIGDNISIGSKSNNSGSVFIGGIVMPDSTSTGIVAIGSCASSQSTKKMQVGVCPGLTQIGYSSSTNGKKYSGAIALGAYSGSGISSNGMMDISSSETSYGYNSSNYRLITGLYDGQSAHDAATKGQLDAAIISGGTTAPTTATVGQVGTLYIYVDSGTPKIMVCTDTTGGTYTWTDVMGSIANQLANI